MYRRARRELGFDRPVALLGQADDVGVDAHGDDGRMIQTGFHRFESIDAGLGRRRHDQIGARPVDRRAFVPAGVGLLPASMQVLIERKDSTSSLRSIIKELQHHRGQQSPRSYRQDSDHPLWFS